jgi:phosphatidylinositol glycan class A protein
MQGRCLGLPSVYTDHSLFSFGDMAGVSLNKVIKCFLTDIDQCIAVSHIGRDNLILRSAVDPRKFTVLPNATVIISEIKLGFFQVSPF